MTIADKAADTPQSSIASTIRSLKPGDRVRVTFEDRVLSVKATDGISDDYVVLASGVDFEIDDPTITSIEVIERPLQVGDTVIAANGVAGSITAIDDTCAIVLVVGKMPHKVLINLPSLRRAS